MYRSELIIFDMDGTLFRTELVDFPAFNHALELFGRAPVSFEAVMDLIGKPMDEISALLLNTDDKELIEKFKNSVLECEMQIIRASSELYPGVQGMLCGLKMSGFRMCICSNGSRDYIEAIVKKFGLEPLFEEIWHYTPGISKTEAVGILKEKYGAERLITVGDRSSDIEAARLNNGISIGVSYGFGKDEIKSADYTANSVKEVEEIIMRISR